jgi:hypothetical protein
MAIAHSRQIAYSRQYERRPSGSGIAQTRNAYS